MIYTQFRSRTSLAGKVVLIHTPGPRWTAIHGFDWNIFMTKQAKDAIMHQERTQIYNEEMIVARCFIGFIIFFRQSLGNTLKVTLDGRIQAIQSELQLFLNPNEVLLESNEQRLLRISLLICGTVVQSLPMARCAPKCEKTVQALLCRNLNVKSATLPNASSSRRIRLQDDLVEGFHISVSERLVLVPRSSAEQLKALIREGLVVLRMVRAFS